ncbi:Unknown protein [Striga hermonthica]|uniref:Uncharacterized protein n=1 Tax=Striga hermonthica TaxID=68872 RepID=A0A9N7NDA2_STRHE|nr:Unknown protein [Striga hermonthica]
MANPRRTSYSSNQLPISDPIPQFQSQTHQSAATLFNSFKIFLKKPHAFPFLLSVFLLLTWVSLRFQHRYSSPAFQRSSYEKNGGGALYCASIHVGEIRPGSMRGNHRHHTCNETFVIWGAKTVFRLENKSLERGYSEITIGPDEIAVAASPRGTAHALMNMDTKRTTFFLGCQDSVINYNVSTTDSNVWKDL